MNTIKRIIIHLLGGYIKEEIEAQSYLEGIKYGTDSTRREIKEFAKGLYGLQENEWNDAMWGYVAKW